MCTAWNIRKGRQEEIIDPYRFGPVITKKRYGSFCGGHPHYEAYKITGAHSCCIDGVKGVHSPQYDPLMP